MNKSKLALAIALTFSLSACGGGDSSDSSSSPDVDKPNPVVIPDAKTNDFSVTAIDGYLQGALVCLDINENTLCDVDTEPYDDQGDELGKYNLAIPADINPANYKVLVEVIAGKTVDMDTPEIGGEREPEAKAYTMTAPKGQGTITPLTTIVQHKITQNPTLSIIAATEEVKEDLGLPAETTVADLLGDYIKTTTGSVNDKPKDMLIRTIAKKLVETEGLLDALQTQATDQNIVDEVIKKLDTVLEVMKQSQDEIQAQANAENEIRKTQAEALIAEENARVAEEEAKAAQAKLDEIEAKLTLATAEEKIALEAQKQLALEAKILKDIEQAEKQTLIDQAKFASEQAALILIEAEAEALKAIEDAERFLIEAERLAAIEAARLEAERLAAIEAARLEAERLAAIEAARLEAERLAAIEAARIEAARLEAERLAAIEAARIEAARLEAERLAAIEAARLEAERLAAIEAARLEAERLAAIEAARLEAERLAAIEAARIEAERLAAIEAARIEAERLATIEAARIEAERLAAIEATRLEAERLAAIEEAARIEAERLAAIEAARIEAERLAVIEAARLEAERLAAIEAARLEAERLAAIEAARLEAERLASIANYGTCMASLDDAGYRRKVGDKAEYNLQRYSNGNQSTHESTQVMTYLGGDFSWSRDFSNITGMPEWYENLNGQLYAEEWSWYDANGEIDSTTENNYFSNDEFYKYYGHESINNGEYSYGSIKSMVAQFNLTSNEILLNQEFSFVSQSTSLSDISAITESTPLSELKQINYAHTHEYLGKEIITVPAGTFEACKVRTTDSVINDDGSLDKADVQLAWFINRGVIKQEQFNPSWAPISHRQALSLPTFGEPQPTVVPLVIANDMFTDNQLTTCVQDALNLHKIDDVSKLETLICHAKSIVNTDGIELLTGLKVLDLSANQITQIDISDLSALDLFNISGNAITTLDVSNNESLILLNLRKTLITSETLVGDSNAIAMLDFIIPDNTFTDNTLKQCVQNQINNGGHQSLEQVKYLDCFNENITDTKGLELLTGLTDLFLANNQITSIDLSLNSLLINLDLNSNPLTRLDISNNLQLESVNLKSTGVTAETLTGDISIVHFDYVMPDGLFSDPILQQCVQDSLLWANSLEEISYLNCYDVENTTGLALLTGLTSLSLPYSTVTSIDLSANTALTELNMSSNQLSTIDLSHNTQLLDVNLSRSLISELDVTANTLLSSLNLSNTLVAPEILVGDANNSAYFGYSVPENVFTDVEFELCVQQAVDNSWSVIRTLSDIGDLSCFSPTLADTAGIESLTGLTYLYLVDTQITSIDLSANVKLDNITLSSNQLMSIDVSNNPLLNSLDLQFNPIVTLDVSANTALSTLLLSGTQVTAETLIGDNNNVATFE